MCTGHGRGHPCGGRIKIRLEQPTVHNSPGNPGKKLGPGTDHAAEAGKGKKTRAVGTPRTPRRREKFHAVSLKLFPTSRRDDVNLQVIRSPGWLAIKLGGKSPGSGLFRDRLLAVTWPGLHRRGELKFGCERAGKNFERRGRNLCLQGDFGGRGGRV